MFVTRTLAGLALALACGYGVLATMGVGWSLMGLIADPEDRLWSALLGPAGGLALAGVVHAVPPLWRTARTGDEQSAAHRRFWLAWLAVLPLNALLYWAVFVQVFYTAMALPVIAGLLLAERYAESRQRHPARSRS